MGSFLLVLVLEVELHRLVRVVGFKLVDIIREVRAIGVHGFKHLQVLSVRSLLATIIIGYARPYFLFTIPSQSKRRKNGNF